MQSDKGGRMNEKHVSFEFWFKKNFLWFFVATGCGNIWSIRECPMVCENETRVATLGGVGGPCPSPQ